ncbi:AAA family ATPase [Methanospirillum purgamenti]|uniref:AAA family ATPase n=1 Tax=Methanospirillum hungatei TaxID=2203 RepID=A0A8F5VNW0_METHU|nr:AAA family ATPase [Methanospirillum hungatei]QXO95666.1 AAA family ATPase [Methanospirillum hungatei]
MISNLSIENFKSIKKLGLKCRKVNIFLGEPNTGKSNILEALGILSWCGQSDYKKNKSHLLNDCSGFPSYPPEKQKSYGVHQIPGIFSYVRFEKMQNLFFKYQIDNPVSISIRESSNSITNSHIQNVIITMNGDECKVIHCEGKDEDEIEKSCDGREVSIMSSSGNIKNEINSVPGLNSIFFYKFVDLYEFPDSSNAPLKSPFGQNLFSVVMYDKKCLEIMKELFSSNEFKFVLKPGENKFEFQQEEDNIVYTYPYRISSDTLRHVAFYTVAIASQKNATLIFEEPESHTFPYYTKFLAEQIWLDSSNQFFIVTHNQYLLSTLIEKVRKEDIAVNIVIRKDGETQVIQLGPDQISEMICTDPFFDLDSFLESNE